uniref:Calcineurin-like phosphoesterase domain-containing protein n=1 Tax=Globisporangium ultimum (strain ATCC 200006 / CBS 805.95 / DAOM BR144) TaxID=431595 RepID=K3X283_GLOUD
MGTYENAFPEETNFIVIGDFGTGSADQVKTSETLKHFAAALDPKPAFVLSTGDQIYEHGISSSSDPVLKTRFEKMYDHPDLNVPWYITIGNHDCEGSIDAMLAYAGLKDSKWYFPQRYYSIDRPVAPKTILRIVVVDACDLVCGHEPRNFRCHEPMNVQTSEVTRLEQYRWIDDVLSAGKPEGVDHMWTIVVGHWGIYSYAGNAHTKELIDSLDPLLNKHNVHAYFNGHDHCMQHIKRLDPSSGRARNYFVSGAGGYPVHTLMPKARANADLVHAAMTHGFMWVKVTKTLFQVQFIDKAGEILYTTEVQY